MKSTRVMRRWPLRICGRNSLTLCATIAIAALVLARLGINSARATEGSGTPSHSTFTARDLLEIVDVVALSLAPDGKHVAFVTNRARLEGNTFDCDLYVIEAESGAKARHLGKVSPHWSKRSGGPVPQKLKWVDDSRAITYVANLDGVEQVWAWSVRGGLPRRLSNASVNVVSHDVVSGGNAIFYTTIALNGSDGDREALARQAREGGMLFQPEVAWGDYLGEVGIQRYVARQFGVTYQHWLHNIETGETRAATQEDLAPFGLGFPGSEEVDRTIIRDLGATNQPTRATPYEMARAPNGKRTALLTTDVPNGQRIRIIVVVDEEGKNRRELYRRLEAGISSMAWDSRGEYLYFHQHQYTNAGYESGIYRIKEGQLEPEPVYVSKNAQITKISFDRSSQTAVFLEATAVQPNRIVLLDLRSMKVASIFDANPWLAKKALQPPHLVAWTDRYGVKGFGYLVKPSERASDAKHPLVVIPYRAKGFLGGGPNNEYPIYPLVALGYAVFVLDVGEAYLGANDADDAGLFARWRSGLSTMEEALRQIDGDPLIDHRRRALVGFSHTADTGWYILTHSDLFQAAVFSDFGLDLFALYKRGYENLSASNFWHTFRVPIATSEGERRWNEVAVSRSAQEISAPVLVNDSDVEFSNGLQIFTTMRGLGKPVELMIYPNSGHVISQPSQRYSIYRRNIDWLRFWLKGEEESGSDNQDQYRRWRLLRLQRDWNASLIAQGRDPSLEFDRQLGALQSRRQLPPGELAPLLRVGE